MGSEKKKRSFFQSKQASPQHRKRKRGCQFPLSVCCCLNTHRRPVIRCVTYGVCVLGVHGRRGFTDLIKRRQGGEGVVVFSRGLRPSPPPPHTPAHRKMNDSARVCSPQGQRGALPRRVCVRVCVWRGDACPPVATPVFASRRKKWGEIDLSPHPLSGGPERRGRGACAAQTRPALRARALALEIELHKCCVQGKGWGIGE